MPCRPGVRDLGESAKAEKVAMEKYYFDVVSAFHDAKVVGFRNTLISKRIF